MGDRMLLNSGWISSLLQSQMPEQLVNHYSAVLNNLESRHDKLEDFCDYA